MSYQRSAIINIAFLVVYLTMSRGRGAKAQYAEIEIIDGMGLELALDQGIRAIAVGLGVALDGRLPLVSKLHDWDGGQVAGGETHPDVAPTALVLAGPVRLSGRLCALVLAPGPWRLWVRAEWGEEAAGRATFGVASLSTRRYACVSAWRSLAAARELKGLGLADRQSAHRRQAQLCVNVRSLGPGRLFLELRE